MMTDIRELEARVNFRRRFWQDLAAKRNTSTSVRIDGQHYVICREDLPKGAMRGHSGREFTIKFNDGRTVTTTNLWGQGEVPDEFKGILQDNARFIP